MNSQSIDKANLICGVLLVLAGIFFAYQSIELELGTAPSSDAEATPAALKAKLESEIARWKPVIEAAGEYAD